MNGRLLFVTDFGTKDAREIGITHWRCYQCLTILRLNFRIRNEMLLNKFATTILCPICESELPPSSRWLPASPPSSLLSSACSSHTPPIRLGTGAVASLRREWPASRLNPGGDGSPLFPPRYQNEEDAKAAILHVVRRDPRQFGIEGTRWTLEHIQAVCDWLRITTHGGFCRFLDRLGISWKSGRQHVHSPDPDYLAKLADITVYVQRGRTEPGRIPTLYLDELTFYRQPTLAKDYEEKGRSIQPLAELGYRTNTPTRIVAALDVYDGRVSFLRASKITVDRMVAFYQQLCETYEDAEQIDLVMDNWPIHFHPDVLAALMPQESPHPRYLPSHWSKEPSQKALKRWGQLNLRIQAIPLPTYASWLNPADAATCENRATVRWHKP